MKSKNNISIDQLRHFFRDVSSEPSIISTSLYSPDFSEISDVYDWLLENFLVEGPNNPSIGFVIQVAALFLPAFTSTELSDVLNLPTNKLATGIRELCNYGLLVPVELNSPCWDKSKVAYVLSEYGREDALSYLTCAPCLDTYGIPDNHISPRKLSDALRNGKARSTFSRRGKIRVKASNITIHDLLVGQSIFSIMKGPLSGAMWKLDKPRTLFDKDGRPSEVVRPDADVLVGCTGDRLSPTWAHRVFIEEDRGQENINELMQKLDKYATCFDREVIGRSVSILFSVCDWGPSSGRTVPSSAASREFNRNHFFFMRSMCWLLEEYDLPVSLVYKVFCNQPIEGSSDISQFFCDLGQAFKNLIPRRTQGYRKFIEEYSLEHPALDADECQKEADQKYEDHVMELMTMRYPIFAEILRRAAQSPLTHCEGNVNALTSSSLLVYCEACINKQEPAQRKNINRYSTRLSRKVKESLANGIMRQASEIFDSHSQSLYGGDAPKMRAFLRGMQSFIGSTMTLPNILPYLYWKEYDMDSLMCNVLSPHFGQLRPMCVNDDPENWDSVRDSYILPRSLFSDEIYVAYNREIAAYHTYLNDMDGTIVVVETPARDLSSYARIARIGHDLKKVSPLRLVMIVEDYREAGIIAKNLNVGSKRPLDSDAFLSFFILEKELGSEEPELFCYELATDPDAKHPIRFK